MNKVVGLLLRAKKYRLVYFEPEMLFQGKVILQFSIVIFKHFNALSTRKRILSEAWLKPIIFAHWADS